MAVNVTDGWKEINIILADFEGIIRGLNQVGEIDYTMYSEIFDAADLAIDRAYNLGVGDEREANKKAFEVHKQQLSARDDKIKELELEIKQLQSDLEKQNHYVDDLISEIDGLSNELSYQENFEWIDE